MTRWPWKIQHCVFNNSHVKINIQVSKHSCHPISNLRTSKMPSNLMQITTTPWFSPWNLLRPTLLGHDASSSSRILIAKWCGEASWNEESYQNPRRSLGQNWGMAGWKGGMQKMPVEPDREIIHPNQSQIASLVKNYKYSSSNEHLSMDDKTQAGHHIFSNISKSSSTLKT